LITAAISLAIGVAFVPLNNIYTAVNAVNPVAGWAMSGLFALPAFFIGYVIRRPGAVMLYYMISGLTWALFSPFGLFGLFASAITGIMAESTQWVGTRYQRYETRPMLIWSVLYALFGILVAGVVFGGLLIEWVLAISAGLASIASYVLAGWLAPRLAQAIARTGVLASTALGQQHIRDI
jgi:energy-coupling factor transport system permease protein